MRVLVVGGGGREHALAWGLANSPAVERLIAAPGNPGIGDAAECIHVAVDDLDGLVRLASDERIELVVIGPEAPLVAGLADRLRDRGIATFGPEAAAARLEGSKAWAKSVMERGGIPTARAGTFTDLAEATAFVDALGGRAVVKADGLAAGKGVTVAADRETATTALRECLEGNAFGAAGSTVVVEELLEGPEVSAFALCDGTTVLPLSLSQDFKRVGDGDTGPNTGGMGAYAPLPFVDAAMEAAIWEVADRTVRTLASMGTTYRGLLYVGLMLTADGPKVLEYNCRFGDPETEVVIPRLGADLAELLMACASGSLQDVKIGSATDAAVTVVLASGGYPGTYATGVPIDGLGAVAEIEDVVVFHAGTESRDGRVVTAGGRVLAVTALGASIAQARERAYGACEAISFEGKTFRTDVAARAAEDQMSRAAAEEERR
jgi:phosphoribosylamine---glycine ligase